MAPKRRHSLAQTSFAAALLAWAEKMGAGMVGTEWCFRIMPPGEERRPLVPDVAFLSYERMPYDEQERTEEPGIAPDVVVEVASPGDLWRDIDEKIRVYLKASTNVIFFVDPITQSVTVHDREGKRMLAVDDVITHSTLSGFKLPVRDLFTLPKPK